MSSSRFLAIRAERRARLGGERLFERNEEDNEEEEEEEEEEKDEPGWVRALRRFVEEKPSL